MKHLVLIMIAVLAIVSSCENKGGNAETQRQRDSLQSVIDGRDAQLNEMMATMNEIQDGLSQITDAENKMNIARSGESANKKAQIQENLQFIMQRMSENRELIDKLRAQLKTASIKGDEFKRAMESLIKQVEEKDKQLVTLREELERKDIRISELDEKVGNLNTDVSNLKSESNAKSQTISSQDKQLNTAWYVFGTKRELKEQNILVNGKVLQSNFNKSYFTKIDIRLDKEIKLYSKSVKLLTMHPSSSYSLVKDDAGQYTVRIDDPQLFWSTSKYLVILVK